MGKTDKKWLEEQLSEWIHKGWISAEAGQQTRQTLPAGPAFSVPLLSIIAIVGGSIAGMVLIWIISSLWYQISPTARIVTAAVFLLLSQASVGFAMFRDRQGTWVGELVAVVHALVVGSVVAVAQQTFYVGWDTASFLVVCALLCLPAIYLLRSVCLVVVYALAVLCWAAIGGPVDAPGGAAFIWVLLVVLVPFYRLLQKNQDEVRLAIYSWTITITVFAAFGLAALDSAYIPFLLLATLAVAIMLTGYSIDIRKAWGVPFRWFGRCAAAGSLLISALPASWYGVADIQGFHWTTTAVTVVLFMSILALLVKGVKKRLWGPVLYAGIPVILAAETILVRNGLYSSVPLIVSSLYLIAIGFYEMVQGYQGGRTNHFKFGLSILVCLIIAVFWGGSFSPLVPVVGIIILALLIFQIRRTSRQRKDTAERVRHRTEIRHKVTTVRSERKKRSSHRRRAAAPPVAETEAAPAEASAQEPLQEEELPEWMKELHLPDSLQEPAAPEAEIPVPAAPRSVIQKETEPSHFVPPVFHNPDDIPLPQVTVPQPRRAARTQQPAKPAAGSTSPWGTPVAKPKREKHFTHSPWSTEGENEK